MDEKTRLVAESSLLTAAMCQELQDMIRFDMSEQGANATKKELLAWVKRQPVQVPPQRYAVEIHLVEIDDVGNTIATTAIETVDDATWELEKATGVVKALREDLGQRFYTWVPESTMTVRATNVPTYPAEEQES